MQIVGIDLYRSIRNDGRLWEVWNERINYFQSLSKNKEILKAEKTAIKATKKVVNVLLKIIESNHERDDKRHGFFFSPGVKYDYPEETELTLKEKLKVYLKDKNYFSVKDQGKFIVSPSGRVWYLRDSPKDVGSFHNCNRVLNQHNSIYKFVQEFVETKIYDEVVRGQRNKEEELSEAFQELAEAIEPIEVKLLTDARSLRTGEFERIQLTAAAFDHSVLGRITKGFESLDKNEKEIEKIKNASIVVCEELAYGLLMKLQNIIPVSHLKKTTTSHLLPENSYVPYGDFKFCHAPLSLKINKSDYHVIESPKSQSEKDVNRALRAIALFVSTPEARAAGLPVTQKFADNQAVGRKLRVTTSSATTQLSVARKFLKKIGSQCSISKNDTGFITMITP